MWIIETDSESCRDCYKCLKECPVKAIRFEKAVSKIVEERCIVCGNCIKVCPQGAKKDISFLDEVKHLVKSDKTVIASLAPSFTAYFKKEYWGKMCSLLKKIGFDYVEETAFGAYYTAMALKKELLKDNERDFIIGTSCPSSVYLVEKYFPEFIPNLSKAFSPIITHAKILKKFYGTDTHIVFISPCVAKKKEISESQYKGLVDYSISFKELEEWVEDENIDLSKLDEKPFDRETPGLASLFPIDGGILKTAAFETDYVSEEYISISGADNIIRFLKNYDRSKYPSLKFVDFLMCEGGCINGPLVWKNFSLENKINIIRYQKEKTKKSKIVFPQVSDSELDEFLERKYENLEVNEKQYSEEEIRKILHRTGKYTKEDELNCGSCGYPTCRDKAIAVLNGMAETEMCIPYMRKKAESFSNLIIEHTPNGVIVVNYQLKIINTNPAFKKIFSIPKEKDLAGESLKMIIGDVAPFIEADTRKSFINKKVYYKNYDKWIDLITYPMIDEKLIVGIFRDITEKEKQSLKLEKVRKEITEKTQDVVLKQMRVAQEIASLLGETTAETKAMLSKFAKIMSNFDNEENES